MSSRTITVVGAVPPPVNGMSVFTQRVVDMLAADFDVKLINLSYGQYSWGRWLRRYKKFSRVLRAFPRILFARRRDVGILYTPLDARAGLYYSLVFVFLARLRGYQVVVHHHVYNYIDQYDRRMGLINRMLGSRGAHVVHCEQMVADFRQAYPEETRFLTLPPTVASQVELTSGTKERNGPLTLGFLSNLAPEKGVEDVLETFTQLCNQGQDVRLIFAGPYVHKGMETLIRDAVSRWPDRVESRGPVYEEAKSKYFAEIDVFLFPTRYASESWGIVLEEALNAGCPVIASQKGCIPWIVRDGCGVVVRPGQQFPEIASNQIADWLGNRQDFEAACAKATKRAVALREVADRDAKDFVQAFEDL